MNHEHEQSHATSSAAAARRNDKCEPGQSSRSALLRKPDHPVASGLTRRKARDGNGVADGAEHAVSAASSSRGSPLPNTLMRKFESSLGADLSAVRVHTGDASARAAGAVGAVGAKAYTMGNDIHFGAGHYDPSSSVGQHLVAHEVAHTVQQSGGARRMQFKLEVSSPGDSLEYEADRAADAMVSGEAATVSSASGLSRHALQQDSMNLRPRGADKERKPKTPTPKITSATLKAAPSGAAATRTTIAVGEIVSFIGSAAGSWTATAGTASGDASFKFVWTAPATPGKATVKLSVETKSATKEFTIIAPNKLSMVKAPDKHEFEPGVAGVCMTTRLIVGPNTVNFGNIQWLEVGCDATGVSGYFKKRSTASLRHNPNERWQSFNDANTGPHDHAAARNLRRPYEPGSFTWVIPNKYRVAAVGDAGKEFFTTYQVFTMKDKKGTMSVSKGGQSVSRPL